MDRYYWFLRFQFWYFLALALVNLIMYIFVTIKICKTTHSVFALTLLSFTPLLAVALIVFAVANFWYNKWVWFICEIFVESLPIQSWLFAMQYFKSYLYTCAIENSLKYKIQSIIKKTVIITYATVLIYLKSREQIALEQY